MNKQLQLFDGTWLFFRALYSIPDSFQNQQGEPVNGVYGFTAFLLKYLHENKIGFAAIAFDESLHTCFRLKIYPQYKANRESADDNIRLQLKYCRKVCQLLGIETFAHKKYEADDLIASMARLSRRQVRIVSKDKDLQQLISSRVQVYDPGTQTVRDLDWFTSNYQFSPRYFTAFQALVGDAVDNVPGVTGIGAKTAQILVSQYGSLDQVANSVSKWDRDGINLPVTGRVAHNLIAEQERMFLMRMVVELKTNIAIKTARNFRIQPASALKINNTFKRLNLLPQLKRSLDRYSVAHRIC